MNSRLALLRESDLNELRSRVEPLSNHDPDFVELVRAGIDTESGIRTGDLDRSTAQDPFLEALSDQKRLPSLVKSLEILRKMAENAKSDWGNVLVELATESRGKLLALIDRYDNELDRSARGDDFRPLPGCRLCDLSDAEFEKFASTFLACGEDDRNNVFVFSFQEELDRERRRRHGDVSVEVGEATVSYSPDAATCRSSILVPIQVCSALRADRDSALAAFLEAWRQCNSYIAATRLETIVKNLVVSEH